jgi:probable phosphoglycerate mutase
MAGGTPAGAGESGGRTLVYLARHGQTPLNESGVLRGLADPPLDQTGRDQARRLGAALGPRGLSAVIASPLLRAKQTAQPVAERAGLKVATDQCLGRPGLRAVDRRQPRRGGRAMGLGRSCAGGRATIGGGRPGGQRAD